LLDGLGLWGSDTLRAFSRGVFGRLLLSFLGSLDALTVLAFLAVVWWPRQIDTLSLFKTA